MVLYPANIGTGALCVVADQMVLGMDGYRVKGTSGGCGRWRREPWLAGVGSGEGLDTSGGCGR